MATRAIQGFCPGRNAFPRATVFGEAVAMHAESRRWRHPWFTQPAWDSVQGQWIAIIKPGFVNGECPIWRTTVHEQRAAGLDFGINPLTGKPFFSDDPPFAPLTTDGPTTRTIDIPLYLSPAITLTWRGLGFDGVPDAAVPRFFLDRGVVPKPRPLSEDDILEGATQDDVVPPNGYRLLRACDLWIHQPRLALTSTIELHPGLATGISNATQTLGVKSAAPGDKLRVMSGTLTPIDGITPSAKDFEEPNYDELLIATVFLLSPPNATPHSDPDGRWIPFVRHNLFWNLRYVTPWFKQYGGDPNVPFIPPLGGGAAQLVINFLTASVNDILQDALNFVTAHSLAGTFYTPTCGGHDATLPVVIDTPRGNTGLDRAGRLTAERVAAARAATQDKLDPDYPYHAEPFDPALLTQST